MECNVSLVNAKMFKLLGVSFDEHGSKKIIEIVQVFYGEVMFNFHPVPHSNKFGKSRWGIPI